MNRRPNGHPARMRFIAISTENGNLAPGVISAAFSLAKFQAKLAPSLCNAAKFNANSA
jgi:hypothetical protein